MTSAASADCHGAKSDSASNVRTKRTVFMKMLRIQRGIAEKRISQQRWIKYRPHMNYLRRQTFAVQQGPGTPFGSEGCRERRPIEQWNRKNRTVGMPFPCLTLSGRRHYLGPKITFISNRLRQKRPAMEGGFNGG